MPDYKEMYFKLAAKIADAVNILIDAQQQGEEAYIDDSQDRNIRVIHITKETLPKE